MSEAAKATGRRGEVVGRRLRWTGDNFDSLRSAQWQVHGYGVQNAHGLRDEMAAELSTRGLELHLFPAAQRTALSPELLYLIRPDGFVAAEAPPAAATRVFDLALPPGWTADLRGASAPAERDLPGRPTPEG